MKQNTVGLESVCQGLSLVIGPAVGQSRSQSRSPPGEKLQWKKKFLVLLLMLPTPPKMTYRSTLIF